MFNLLHNLASWSWPQTIHELFGCSSTAAHKPAESLCFSWTIIHLSPATERRATLWYSSVEWTCTHQCGRVIYTHMPSFSGQNEVWVGFSLGFSRFPLPQISFHHFSTLLSSISFHFISPRDCASGVVGQHPCYSQTYNIGASSHLIPRPDLVLDTSWGYLLGSKKKADITLIEWFTVWS